eukprot:scaffold910_cov396-Prasinococcus_capsulatus_cf.AAC.18
MSKTFLPPLDEGNGQSTHANSIHTFSAPAPAEDAPRYKGSSSRLATCFKSCLKVAISCGVATFSLNSSTRKSDVAPRGSIRCSVSINSAPTCAALCSSPEVSRAVPPTLRVSSRSSEAVAPGPSAAVARDPRPPCRRSLIARSKLAEDRLTFDFPASAAAPLLFCPKRPDGPKGVADCAAGPSETAFRAPESAVCPNRLCGNGPARA